MLGGVLSVRGALLVCKVAVKLKKSGITQIPQPYQEAWLHAKWLLLVLVQCLTGYETKGMPKQESGPVGTTRFVELIKKRHPLPWGWGDSWVGGVLASLST